MHAQILKMRIMDRIDDIYYVKQELPLKKSKNNESIISTKDEWIDYGTANDTSRRCYKKNRIHTYFQT